MLILLGLLLAGKWLRIMSLNILDELVKFCEQHINNHGANHRSKLYIEECCKLWEVQFDKGTAKKIYGLAMDHYKSKGGK